MDKQQRDKALRSIVWDTSISPNDMEELIDGNPGALAQMVEVYNQTGSSVLGVSEVNPEDVSSYGIVKLADKSLKFKKIEAIIEKPSQENAPSNLAAVGRYILTPRIFNELRNTPRGVGGEIQLTDAISEVLHYEAIFAHIIDGKRYDCGSKLGYLEATIGYGLKHPEIGEQLRDYLKQLQLEL